MLSGLIKFGTLVFINSITNEILIWKYIESEIVQNYKYLEDELLSLGYTILSVTIDGKRGLYKAFEGIPIQMCHFVLTSLRNSTSLHHQKRLSKGTLL